MLLGDRSTVSMNLTPDKTTYGSYVRVYDDEKLLKLRLLVSIHIDGDPNSDATFNDTFNTP